MIARDTDTLPEPVKAVIRNGQLRIEYEQEMSTASPHVRQSSAHNGPMFNRKERRKQEALARRRK